MTGPREPVQTHPPEWDTSPAAAGAWLLGYVRTDAPGYREVVEGVDLYTCASGEYRFNEWVEAMSTALTLSGVSLSWLDYGAVSRSGFLTFSDRAGWLMGFGTEPGVAVPWHADVSPFVPPAGIPLIAATWAQAEHDADRRHIIDLYKRNQGYVWGGCTIWHCKLVLHRWALEALKTGWCLSGKVTLGCADMLDTPISSSEPRGAITGYALGLGSVSWLDSIQQTARVEFFMVTA